MAQLTIGQAEDTILAFFEENIPSLFSAEEIIYPNAERNDTSKNIELSLEFGDWKRFGASRTSLKRCDVILSVVISVPKGSGNSVMIDTIDHIDKAFDTKEFRALGFVRQGFQVDDGVNPEKYSKSVNIVTYIEGS